MRASATSWSRFFAIAFETATQQPPDLGAGAGGQRGPAEFLPEHRGSVSEICFALERAAARQHFVRARRRTPRCPRACRRPCRAPAPGHVRGRAENHARRVVAGGDRRRIRQAAATRAPVGSMRLREAEVEHLHRAVGADLDVGGLQIAMNDALLVRGFERVRDLPRDRQRFGERRPRRARDASASRSSPSTSSITRARDARRLPRVRRSARCSGGSATRASWASRSKRASRSGSLANSIGQDLDRDVAVELRVAGAIHLAHSASAQLGEDLVGTYRFSNHSQILAWATASLAEARRSFDGASEGGPPAPMAETTSYGPRRVPVGSDMAWGIVSPLRKSQRCVAQPFHLRAKRFEPQTAVALAKACTACLTLPASRIVSIENRGSGRWRA